MSLTVVIRKCPKLGLCIYINNQNHEHFLTYDERVQCLGIANERFDRQIDFVAQAFRDHEYGKYLWVYTPEFIRTEQIEGLLRQHYLTAILELLIQRYQSISAILESIIPCTLFTFLRENCAEVRVSKASYLLSCIKFYGSRLVIVMQKTLMNFGYIFRQQNPPHNGVLIDIFRDMKMQRFDNISAITGLFPSHKFYSGQEEMIRGVPRGKIVDFRRELRFSQFFIHIVKTVKLTLFILKNKNRIPPELFNNLTNFINLLMFFDLLIYEHCVDRYFKKNRITRLLHVATLAKPAHRILMSSAKNHGAKVILVASRSLARFAPADRLLKCDVDEINDVKLPDHFILKDKYSLKAFELYPHFHHKLLIGARYRNLAHPNAEKGNLPVALYILLNYKLFLCVALLEEIRAVSEALDVETVIYRSHPLCYISPETVGGYFPGKKIIDNSGKDYSVINQYRTIVASGPSTGALELADTFSVIVWAPYIWDNGILMDDLMNKVGIKCTNRTMLNAQLKKLVYELDAYKNQVGKDGAFVNEFFNTRELISDKVRQIELQTEAVESE